MTAPHPDDPLYDDWEIQKELDDLAAAERLDDERPWQINDDAGANWALRKIAKAEAEIARINLIAQAELDRIQQWRADATKAPSDDVSFFRGHLIDYRRRLEENDPSLPKTYRLPAGDITRRRGPTRVEVADEKAFVAWAVQNDPSLLSLKPLVSRLKDQKDRYLSGVPDGDESVERAVNVVARTGEIVPGVRYVFEPERYGVKAR